MFKFRRNIVFPNTIIGWSFLIFGKTTYNNLITLIQEENICCLSVKYLFIGVYDYMMVQCTLSTFITCCPWWLKYIIFLKGKKVELSKNFSQIITTFLFEQTFLVSSCGSTYEQLTEQKKSLQNLNWILIAAFEFSGSTYTKRIKLLTLNIG